MFPLTSCVAMKVAICPDKILGTAVAPSNNCLGSPGWCCDGTTGERTDCKVTVRDIDAKWCHTPGINMVSYHRCPQANNHG